MELRQDRQDDVVGRISQDLRTDTGGVRGFSRRNLFYMRRFAALWPDPENVQPLAAQLGWTHHQVLLDAFADDPERYEWYAAQVVELRWSRRHLKAQIDLRLHERTGAAVANFPAVLESADAQRALDATKDPYVFDFLDLSEGAHERELEQALIDDINAVDEQLRRGDDQESVGIVLCTSHDETVAKLALHRVYAPIAVSTWRTDTPPALPPVDVTDHVPADLPNCFVEHFANLDFVRVDVRRSGEGVHVGRQGKLGGARLLVR